jgi:hypothetical protein
MSRIVGNEGTVSLGNHQLDANAWSLTISRVVSDVTAFDDGSATVRGGVPTYTGSISGFMKDDGDPQLEPSVFTTADTVAITLTASSGETVACAQAIISGVSISTSKTGDATISFDFSFSGTVTSTWGS